ncbi:MAG: cell envelope integrity protein TolA, partial [Deltaproteobacteria bacterium]|nr:cell envelope integrity protein TolA [Deltaproteobacteria bacterium]
MSGELTIDNREQIEGARWGIMLTVSIILHLSVFSAAVFIPGLSPSRDLDSIVYEVDLVDMSSLVQEQSSSAKSSGTKEAEVKTEVSAKRIAATEEKKAAEVEKISISKKKTTSKKQETSKTEKTKTDNTAHLSNAISKIRKKTASEENHLDKAMAELQDKVGTGAGSGSGASGTGVVGSLSMRIYQINVKSHIQNNWSYPAAMQNRKDLEVTVLLRVKKDGTIMKSEFKKKSKDTIFDQSVIKAIEKSNPIPPFPEGYEKSY